MLVAIRPASDSCSGTPYFNDAVTSPVQIKAAKGQIYWLYPINTTAAAAYLQIWFKPLTGVTFGVTVPDMQIRLISNASTPAPMPPLMVPVGGTGTGLTVAGTSASGATTSTAAISLSAVYL